MPAAKSDADAAMAAMAALERADPSDPARGALTLDAVERLGAAGRATEAVLVAEAHLVLATGPLDVLARLRLALSTLLLLGGRADEAAGHTAAVLVVDGLSDDLYDDAVRGQLANVMSRRDFHAMRELAEAVLAGTERSETDGALAGALTSLAFVAMHEGRMADAIGLLRAAVTRSDRRPPNGQMLLPRLGLAMALANLGEAADADRLVAEIADEPQVIGQSEWPAAASVTRARIHLVAGRLDGATADAEQALAIADSTGRRGLVPFASWVLALVALQQGELDEAARHVAQYEYELELQDNTGAPSVATYTVTAARVAAAVADDTGAALPVLAPMYEELTAQSLELVVDPTAAAFLVRAALDAGDTGRAEACAAAAERLAGMNVAYPSVTASAAHARGVAHRDIAALEQAAELHRVPWARGLALEELGALLVDGDSAGARARLAASLEQYERVGATGDAARARGRLDDLDAPTARGRGRPSRGWLALSPTEMRVAELVADGLTNAQVAERIFLSRHTVDFHLRQIFRKLAVSSRVELTRRVVERAKPGS
jgi:DNA-binding CsgD family transcriptional regulator